MARHGPKGMTFGEAVFFTIGVLLLVVVCMLASLGVFK